MIAITGASGNLGKATLSFLLQKTEAHNLIAVVRDPSRVEQYAAMGVQVRTADYTDPGSLDKAFAGVHTLLQISSSAAGEEATRQEANVVAAARRQSVSRIVYTSTLHPTGDAYFLAAHTCRHTEDLIRKSGMQYTLFRNSMYHETVPLFIGSAMEDGQIFYPAANGKVSFVSRMDIAEALAAVLTAKWDGNQTYAITGSAALGFADIAVLLRETMGLPASFTAITLTGYQAALEEAGMSAEENFFYSSMAQSIEAGEFAATDTALQELLGRQPLHLQTYLQHISPAVS